MVAARNVKSKSIINALGALGMEAEMFALKFVGISLGLIYRKI